VLADFDHLVLNTYDQGLYVLDPESGSVKNKKKLWYQPIGNMLSHNDQVLVPQRNGNIGAYRFNSLMRIWNSRSAVNVKDHEIDISISSIAISDPYIYVSKHWGNLYVLDLDTGKMLMDPGVPYESRISVPAVVHDHTVIFGNTAGELHAFSKNGKQRYWESHLPHGYPTSILIVDQNLYVLSSEKTLMCMDLKSKKWLWDRKLEGYGFNSISFEDDLLLVGAKNLYAFDRFGKELWKIVSDEAWGICRGPSVLMDKQLVVSHQEGVVEVYDWNGSHLPIRIQKWTMPASIWNPVTLGIGEVYVSDVKGHLASFSLSIAEQ
jgi:outer membrane protein assembly factor BamB